MQNEGKTRRWRRAAFVAGALAGLYVAGYVLLYRRGASEAVEHGLPGLLYVPAESAAEGWGQEPHQHTILAGVYAPLNIAHHRLLGGREAYRGPPPTSTYQVERTVRFNLTDDAYNTHAPPRTEPRPR